MLTREWLGGQRGVKACDPGVAGGQRGSNHVDTRSGWGVGGQSMWWLGSAGVKLNHVDTGGQRGSNHVATGVAGDQRGSNHVDTGVAGGQRGVKSCRHGSGWGSAGVKSC